MTGDPEVNSRLKVVTLAILSGLLPINALRDMGYAALSFEVLSLASIFLLSGAVLGRLTQLSYLYYYFLAFSCYAVIDTNFLESTKLHIVLALLSFFTLLLIFRICKARSLPYVFVFAAVFSILSLFRAAPPVIGTSGGAMAHPDAPTTSILHIVLDEMGSPYNVAYAPPADHPAARIFADFESWGFEVHSQAYSRYSITTNSLSSIMSLNPENFSVIRNAPGASYSFSTEINSYFKKLIYRNFSVSVLQSSHLDHCLGNQNIKCETYSRTGSGNAFGYSSLSERFRFSSRALQSAFAGKHRPSIFLFALLDRYINGPRPVLQSYVPVIAQSLLEIEALEMAKSIEPGQAYYVHALFPHFPYLFDADCNRVALDNVGLPERHARTHDGDTTYRRYWDQVACAHKLVEKIVRATADKEFLTIIIHGDHGPRVYWYTPNENRDDLNKTFVAVRGPNIAPGRKDDEILLQDVVIQYLIDFLKDPEGS